MRAENPAVLQIVAGQLQKAVADLIIETALGAECAPLLADVPVDIIPAQKISKPI